MVTLMTDTSALEAKISNLETAVAELTHLVRRSSPPELMTTAECADYLKVSTERLYQLRKEGGGPPFCQPTDRWVRYRRADVDAWVLSGQGQV